MQLKRIFNFIGFFVLLLLLVVKVSAQSPTNINANLLNRSGINPGSSTGMTVDSKGRPIKKEGKSDSLQHRDAFADSITIYYRYFDSTRNRIIDSSINDFYTRNPLAANYHTLGNYGSAAQSYLFSPNQKIGFDEGLHQYDAYKFTLENTKFYQTTRPYSELAYLLGSKAEQLISVLLTQNKKSNFNYTFEYRFSNTPGFLKTQNSSHNNFRVTTHYQSKNKRYESFFIYLSNKAASSENGGLQNAKKLDSLSLNDPFELETRLGKAGSMSRNPFNTAINTGNIYKETTVLYKHHYDFGKLDSLVTDSITIKIFYPRFRLEHTLKLGSSSYGFSDISADSTNYAKYFNYKLPNAFGDTFQYKDAWTEINNEFSIITFPDKNNQSQFLKAGMALQNLSGLFDPLSAHHSFYNVYGLGEYRNRTRNQKWDIEANGQLYLNGLNAGDYTAYLSMKSLLGKKIGSLNIGFQNTNKSPAFMLDPLSSYPVKNKIGFKKENIFRFFLQYDNPKIGWKLNAEYFVVNNYVYFDSFFTARQEASLFNVLHISAEKKLAVSRHWNFYTEIHMQQTTGDPPVNLPFLYTRNRIAFEGNFFTNLFISTGLELRYQTPYKADGYSPFLGQFYYQNTQTINNRPDISAYLNFRIKSFKAFLRVENLNTINPSDGFKFNHHNFSVEQYPNPGMWVRFGVWWNFVN